MGSGPSGNGNGSSRPLVTLYHFFLFIQAGTRTLRPYSGWTFPSQLTLSVNTLTDKCEVYLNPITLTITATKRLPPVHSQLCLLHPSGSWHFEAGSHSRDGSGTLRKNLSSVDTWCVCKAGNTLSEYPPMPILPSHGPSLQPRCVHLKLSTQNVFFYPRPLWPETSSVPGSRKMLKKHLSWSFSSRKICIACLFPVSW